MATNLLAAHSQWNDRPADERFWTLRDMHAACVNARNGAIESKIAMRDLTIVARDGALMLNGNTGQTARFTHYAFGQLCSQIGAPAGYLRELPTATAADCMNVGIQRVAADRSPRNLLFHKNGGLTLRASLSDDYDRVWDHEVCEALKPLIDAGWKAPAGRAPIGYAGVTRPATAADILPGQINIREGDDLAPSGYYASDHDMFAFLVAPDRVISDGNGGTLMRGVFVRNSEVGDASLSFTFFLMQAVCGNHIVWNATGVHEARVRHVGSNTLRRGFRGLEMTLRKYREAAPVEEAQIQAARSKVLGQKKEDVLSAVVAYCKGHSIPLSQSTISNALDVAADHESWYGAPNTVWAVVAGLTHASQSSGRADERADIDRAAGKVMRMAF